MWRGSLEPLALLHSPPQCHGILWMLLLFLLLRTSIQRTG